MTLPDERYRTVIQTRRFLLDLCDPKHTPRIPKLIRDRARSMLRHYPDEWDMDRVAEASPEVFVKHLDPLYKMVKRMDMEERLEKEVEEDLREAKQQGLIQGPLA